MKQRRTHDQTCAGFSLVEMLVTVSIFLIITTVVIMNQNKFSSDIALSNVTYEVALKIRQMQTYGILVRESDSDFSGAYGVHFYKNDGEIKFRAFADNPDSGNQLAYDDDVIDELLGIYSLAEGNEIIEVCTVQCLTLEDDDIEHVDIVFKRPEPSAIISDSDDDERREVIITVASALGDKERFIKVLGTGQISVYAE